MALASLLWLAIGGAFVYLALIGIRDRTLWQRVVGALGLVVCLNGLAFSLFKLLRQGGGKAAFMEWAPIIVLVGGVGVWAFVGRMVFRRKRFHAKAGQVLLNVRPVRKEWIARVFQICMLSVMVAAACLQLSLQYGEKALIYSFMPFGMVFLMLPSLFLVTAGATVGEHGLVDNLTFIPWAGITDYAWSTREGPHLTLTFSSEEAYGGRRFEAAGTHRWAVRLEQVEEVQALLDQRLSLPDHRQPNGLDDGLADEIDHLPADGTSPPQGAYLR